MGIRNRALVLGGQERKKLFEVYVVRRAVQVC